MLVMIDDEHLRLAGLTAVAFDVVQVFLASVPADENEHERDEKNENDG